MLLSSFWFVTLGLRGGFTLTSFLSRQGSFAQEVARSYKLPFDKLPPSSPDAASGLLGANGWFMAPFVVSSDRSRESYSDLSNHESAERATENETALDAITRRLRAACDWI